MKFSRATRWFVVVFALLGMFSMQLALAAYACPKVDAVQRAEMAAMPDCPGMDDIQPALCKTHCQPKQQLLDKAELPPVAPFAMRGFGYLMGSSAELEPAAVMAAIAEPLLARATAPPIAIANCCFRI